MSAPTSSHSSVPGCAAASARSESTVYDGPARFASSVDTVNAGLPRTASRTSASRASTGERTALYGQSRGPDFDQEFTLKAMTQWEGLVQADPGSPWATLARQRIGECRARLGHKLWRSGDVYLKLKLYDPARTYFRTVIDEYPDTPAYGDALIGNAIADARTGKRDSAIVVLEDLAHRFEGLPVGIKAASTLTHVRKWPAEGDRKRLRHRTVEPSQAVPQTPTPASTTPFAP